MNTNLRALTFGIAAATAMSLTFDAMSAADATQVVRLDPVVVTAHRANFDADGNLHGVRLAPVVVTARRTSFEEPSALRLARGENMALRQS